jgi:hypothetical protein
LDKNIKPIRKKVLKLISGVNIENTTVLVKKPNMDASTILKY